MRVSSATQAKALRQVVRLQGAKKVQGEARTGSVQTEDVHTVGTWQALWRPCRLVSRSSLGCSLLGEG